jgi:CheY-like chemotaxis protein
VFFPEASATAEAARAPGPEPLPGGTETILLVEDEEAVREVTTEQLESLGYRVLSCSGAKEALAVAARHEGPLDLLLTDVVMPEVNGRELAVRLREARPGVGVLFTSGYGADVIGRHGVLDEGVLLLQKPYSLLVLARKIRQALAA